jgi:hypothetical protein
MGKPGPVEPLSRHQLEALLESLESAISELQSLKQPRLEGLLSRLVLRRAEVVAAMAARGRPEEPTR